MTDTKAVEEIIKTLLPTLTKLRKTLHQHPNLSNQEKPTADLIEEHLKKFGVNRIKRDIGGHGLLARIDFGGDGPTILYRADLDALPIHETGDRTHKSTQKAVAHSCGHDGHMTLLLGLGALLSALPCSNGSVWLLFQPAEETGEGAWRVLKDPAFSECRPDYAFGFHNLPGFAKGKVVLREGSFSLASVGLRIVFSGTQTHASEAYLGKNPSLAVARFIEKLSPWMNRNAKTSAKGMATVTHLEMGEKSFGISPGEAEVFVTLRAAEEKVLEQIKKNAKAFADEVASSFDLTVRVSEADPFPAVHNHTNGVEWIRKSSQRAGLDVLEIEDPFPWSEDFGHFLSHFPGAMFGLGAGEDQPMLHDPAYDFPNEILQPGILLLDCLTRSLLGSK